MARAAALYEGAIRDLIHRLKYDGKVQVRRPLALLMAQRLAGFADHDSSDLLLPVPLHLKRIRERGFNQAILLGELLAREWKIPFERSLLRRIRWTEPQVNLAAGERAANVRGAFAVGDPSVVKGRRVILVDDVLTTGSTVSECSRVLKRAGAVEVFVATVARVPALGN
jgi:ComF family protein